VSTELQEPEGVEAAQAALDEFRASHDECNQFFGGVFDELQSLSLELFARHKCQEQNSGNKSASDAALTACQEEVRHAVEQIQQVADKVESQVERLASVAGEIAQTRGNTPSDAQMAAVLEAMQSQQADWIQQRAALEAEIETLRSRAAAQTEALHEQKRIASRQQAELTGELKRMRSLLEALAGEVRGDSPVAAEGRRPPIDATVLGSVLAQFQMLQRDAVSRNGKRNGEAGPSSMVPDASAT
jgi:DNA repair exonuclease SbcCD ATPase subunit